MKCFDASCRKTLFEVRDLLKDVNQKLSHMIEQSREERFGVMKDGNNFVNK